MTLAPLLLIGGGGHLRSVIDAALSSGRAIAGVSAFSPEEIGREVMAGVRYVTADELLADIKEPWEFVITLGAVGHAYKRIELWNKALASGLKPAEPVVASTARVSPFAAVGRGSVILHGACVNAGAEIGENCIINTLACIEHDSRIGAHTHVSTGAIINGGCNIGSGAFIGSGAILFQQAEVADNGIITAGAIVRNKL